MTFEELADQAIAMLERRGRVTYRALKRQFQLDDDVLEEVTVEIIKAQRLAADEDGEVLMRPKPPAKKRLNLMGRTLMRWLSSCIFMTLYVRIRQRPWPMPSKSKH